MPTVCPNEWIALLVITMAWLGNWLYSSGRGGAVAYYLDYAKARKSRKIGGMPPPWLFGVMWSVLYVLLLFATFVIYYHDDTCDSIKPVYTADAQFWIWTLIIVNLLSNKAWDRALDMRPFSFAKNAAAILTLFTWATAFVLALLTSIVALKDGVHEMLYFSAVVFWLYTAWLTYASYLAIAQAGFVAL